MSPLYSPVYSYLRPGRQRLFSIRSPMLDEFRTNKNRKWELSVSPPLNCASIF